MGPVRVFVSSEGLCESFCKFLGVFESFFSSIPRNIKKALTLHRARAMIDIWDCRGRPPCLPACPQTADETPKHGQTRESAPTRGLHGSLPLWGGLGWGQTRASAPTRGSPLRSASPFFAPASCRGGISSPSPAHCLAAKGPDAWRRTARSCAASPYRWAASRD